MVGTSKRNNAKKKPAPEKAARPKLDIEGIKAKLVQSDTKPNFKVLAEASSNVQAVKESLVQQFFAGTKAKSRSDVDFSITGGDSSSVIKMKDMFEFGSNQTSEPSTPVKAIEIKSLQVHGTVL